MLKTHQLPNRVLVIDEKPEYLESLKIFLQEQKIQLHHAPSPDRLFKLINDNPFDIALISHPTFGVHGLTLLQKLRNEAKNIENQCIGGILLSDEHQLMGKTEKFLADELGGVETITLPMTPIEVIPFLNRCWRRRNRENLYRKTKNEMILQYEKSKSATVAVEVLQKLIPQIGDDSWYMLTEFYEDIGKVDISLRLVEKISQRTSHSDDIRLTMIKARLCLKTNNLPQSRYYFEKADHLAPMNINRVASLIDLYLLLGQPNESIAKMRDLIKMHFDVADLSFQMVDKLMDHGFHREATSFCQEIATSEEISRYYNNRGVQDSRSKKFSNAVLQFQRALTLGPDAKNLHKIHFNLALALLNQGGKTKALKKVESQLKKSLDNCIDFRKSMLLLDELNQKW